MEQKTNPEFRQSGILVHPTSFPGPYGIGDLGKGAYDFIDFLQAGDRRSGSVCPSVRQASAIRPISLSPPLPASL